MFGLVGEASGFTHITRLLQARSSQDRRQKVSLNNRTSFLSEIYSRQCCLQPQRLYTGFIASDSVNWTMERFLDILGVRVIEGLLYLILSHLHASLTSVGG